ncbi:MAG: hypothetical protein CMC08_01210 [Flavobacteriaceae bacterium]|nr:hypothetical protein [Flavobacteriaceae bacterium]
MADHKPIPSNNRKAAKYRGAECLNCGQPLDLSDIYCPYCSQLNSTKQLSFKDFLGEFVNSIVTYDSRLQHTVRDLLFRPGTITKNYVQGQRLKYANPFRFFLSVSIIFFLVNGLVTSFTTQPESFLKNGTEDGDILTASSLKNKDFFYVNNNGEKDTLRFTDNAVAFNGDTLTRFSKEDNKGKNYVAPTEAELDTLSWGDRVAKRFYAYHKFHENHEITDPVAALDSMKHHNTAFNRWAYNKNKSIDKIEENPFEFANYLMTKIPFFLFFFTPLFALFFWMIYANKKHTYVEHVVFIFHIFSFLFLALLICLLPDTLINDGVFSGILFLFVGPFYFYKALRNFYGQSRLKTILKFVFLNIIFGLSATVAAFLFFAATAATY